MKKNQKLMIKKEKISSLSNQDMNAIHGGAAEGSKKVCVVVGHILGTAILVSAMVCRSQNC